MPSICSTTITSWMQSDTDAPVSTSGGYSVQPAPSDSSLHIAIISSSIDITSSSRASRLSLGAPKSHAMVSCGSPQFPANDINSGIMKKNTIPIPWRDTITLYQPVPLKYMLYGPNVDKSIRMSNEEIHPYASEITVKLVVVRYIMNDLIGYKNI